jgi:DNA polymerase (family 10)
MVNGYIALAFQELATLLELQGESPFKTKAYRTFAETVGALTEPLAAIAARGELESMPGVGKAIAGKTRELLDVGRMRALEEARTKIPPTLATLLRVPGLGPAKVRKLWQEIGVVDLKGLVAACRDGRLATVGGFTQKSAVKLLADAEALLSLEGFALLGDCSTLGTAIARALVEAGASRARIAGAARRGCELVTELAIVVVGLDAEACARALAAMETLSVDDAIEDARGVVKAKRIGADAPTIRVRCVPPADALVALIEETGDDAHVAALRAEAAMRSTTLAAICATCDDEDAVYAALGLATTPPEQREGSALRSLDAPSIELLPMRGVRGVFHVHTDWSDGSASIADMARAALDAGYAYVGISDHSRAATYANGLDEARLAAQRDEIERARVEVPAVTIFHGLEVDIMDDGSLDLPDEALARLDFVVASIHSRFQLDRHAQTRRIVRAVAHPLVTILGHPTGRLLLGRSGYDFDLEAVAKAAAASGCALEINASPQRLDLSPDHIRVAASLGARFAISPDAHEPRAFGDVPLGVAQARRASLRSDQILNALPTHEMVEALRARRQTARATLGVS